MDQPAPVSSAQEIPDVEFNAALRKTMESNQEEESDEMSRFEI